jgi:hypothetical protein
MGSKSLETPHKDYKKVMLKDTADVQSHCEYTQQEL